MILPDEALDSDIAILGKKGRGKTYTAKGVVERLLDLKRRVLILDPLSTWWGLRTMADGETAGYPIAVFGGPKADVQISDKSGRDLAQVIAKRNLPAIIDMGEMRKAEWQRLVGDLLEELFAKNRDPLTIVLEEADVFAPQQPMKDQSTRVLGEVDRIARRGRAFGFRLISITQRPAKLNKDVLTQLSVLITMGITSPQDRDAIKAWIEGNADRDQTKKVESTLSKLGVGEGWVWAPDFDILERTKFPAIKTLDTSKTPKAGEKRIEPKTLADVDTTELKALLEPEPQEEVTVAPSADALRAAEQRGYQRGVEEQRLRMKPLEIRASSAEDCLRVTKTRLREALHGLELTVKSDDQPSVEANPVPRTTPSVMPEKQSRTKPDTEPSDVSPSAQKILQAIHASFPVSLSFAAAAKRAGVSKRSSAYRSYRQEIEKSPDVEMLNDGNYRSRVGNINGGYDPQKTLDEFRRRLPPSYSKMLSVIADQDGQPLDRAVIADLAGISPKSSGLNAGLKELESLSLIERRDNGFALSEDLVVQ